MLWERFMTKLLNFAPLVEALRFWSLSGELFVFWTLALALRVGMFELLFSSARGTFHPLVLSEKLGFEPPCFSSKTMFLAME